MNVSAEIDVFDVRRAILEFKLVPKSVESKQKTTSKQKTNDNREAFSAPQGVQSFDLSSPSTFWSASRREGFPREAPTSSPKIPQELPRVAQETPKMIQIEPKRFPKRFQDHLEDKKSIS